MMIVFDSVESSAMSARVKEIIRREKYELCKHGKESRGRVIERES